VPGGIPPLPSSLYVICDADACERAGWTLADFASACLDGGARLLQVRAKHVTARWLLDTTMEIVKRAVPSGALVVVNDRADVARLAGAGGVHVGQEDLAPASVRLVAGPDAVVGLSTHTVEQCEAASSEPVSYIAVGPVFGTITKSTGYDPVGLEHVRRLAAHASARGVPLVAIGGISLERARSVIEAGARSVAVIGDLLTTGDPRERVGQFLRELGEAN
jgi:thiamine-phosphate pyrophosphorylase